jgi:beta-galactosidase
VDPDCFDADEKTYFRYTRWRATRAVAQLLANLGATFPVNNRVFHPAAFTGKLGVSIGPNGDRSGPQATPPPGPEIFPSSAASVSQDVGYYSSDYRADFPVGDNPYRYYRWLRLRSDDDSTCFLGSKTYRTNPRLGH